jgi:predicted ATPase/class 3 adenylate cyclase
VARRQLPTGTVTLVFTDIEGSTRLLQQLGDRYGEVLSHHRRVLREVFRRHGGVEVDMQGDAFFYVFPKATHAAAAAQEGQTALSAGQVRVRMGVHTGEPLVTDEGYIGVDVHRAARICAAAHGGQIVLSDTTARLVEADLQDLGEQWLKDLDAPQRLYQVGHGAFPPLRTVRSSNLPVPATGFIGREREGQEVSQLLREHRLVTLVGPGGSGKTRLALHVADAATNGFKDGVYWVSLAPVREPDLVEPAIARALDVKDGLVSHLAGQQALLVLDNFEQVIDAAPGLAELLGATAAVKLLVTSREPLQLSGEWAYAVPPLPQADAIALFTERARALRTDFEPDGAVAEVCRRLDGLPLALELAAARVQVLTLPQILERLGRRLDLLTAGARDLPVRQRTLRATVDWSYDLLAPGEQKLFARLAVFAGGWTLDAAEAICDADLDVLQSLVAKNLVRQAGARFAMLETLREYALERLKESADREYLRDRHARFFLALAEQARPELERAEQEAWTRRLNAEYDNLRAAWQHFTESSLPELELRLVAAIWKFWFDQGLWQESSHAVEHALAAASGTTPARTMVTLGAAWTAWRRGDVPAGLRYAEESLRLSRALGDQQLIATALRIMGLCVEGDDRERAVSLFDESARLAESAGDLTGLTASLNNRAIMALEDGDHRLAAGEFRRCLSISRQAGNKRMCAGSLLNLASSERHLGETRQAWAHLTESLAIARALGIREVIVEVLYTSAALADAAGDHRWAGTLIGAAQREGDFGHVFDTDVDRVAVERTLSSVEQNLGRDGLQSALAAGRAMTADAISEYLERAAGAPGDSSDVRLPATPT